MNMLLIHPFYQSSFLLVHTLCVPLTSVKSEWYLLTVSDAYFNHSAFL